ncbi:hypothetical protein AHAT_08330 [Agarivorans sp. Toyoura001]|nr:hypothetical protein AHAT_08330 [Agarivorans sp. Toyoura001]
MFACCQLLIGRLIGGLVFIGSISNVFAADYFVTNGVNAISNTVPADGSRAKPWNNLQYAVNQLAAGDQLWVTPGEYHLTTPVNINSSGQYNQAITISSLPGERANTLLVGAGFSIKQQSHITIEGFTIQQAFNGIYLEGSSAKPVSHITLRNNHTFQTVQSGIAVWGVAWQQDPQQYNNLSQLTIDGNIIQQACLGEDDNANNGYNEAITVANGVHDFEIKNNQIFDGGNPRFGGEGIDLKEGVKNGSIHNNLIHGLHRRGIYLDAGGLLGFSPPFVKNIKIYNNTVHNIREAFSEQSGERLFEGAGAMAIMTEGNGSVSDIEIFDNQFFDTDEDGILIYQHPKGSGLVSKIEIHNNHIYQHKRAGILLDFASAKGIVINHNWLHHNSSNLALKQGESQQHRNFFSAP